MYPTIFSIGPLTLHSYGLLLALGFLVGLRIAIHYGKKDGIGPSTILDLVLFIFIAALLGAKLLELIVNFSYYRSDWRRLLDVFQLGGVYYGGLIFAILITIWYTRRRKISFWKTTDVLVMGLAGGQILGRVGCFLAGCCWGKPVSPYFPLAVTFTNLDAARQVGTPLNVPLHPVQLYEAALLLAVFFVLAWFYPRRKFYGQQLCLYLSFYASLRFALEFFRDDPRGSIFNGILSTSQFISILLIGLVILMFFTLRSRRILAPESLK